MKKMPEQFEFPKI